jgi:hypothetical protein|tara:strand:+ start:588 stop:1355 length:768 start_codon:yes stop_codon:yes gene_type:complete
LVVGIIGYIDNNFDIVGMVRVYSGADGSLLYALEGGDYHVPDDQNEWEEPVDLFGKSVSGAGDVNGDGYDDIIVGSPDDDPNGYDSGSARVFSGIDGHLMYTFNGNVELSSDLNGDEFGTAVSAAGDVNGDGYDDLIVGSPGDDNNGQDSGSAQVFLGGPAPSAYDSGVLIIPAAVVDGAYYWLEFTFSNYQTLELELTSYKLLDNPKTEGITSYASGVLSIPVLQVGTDRYSLELTLIATEPTVIFNISFYALL